MVCSPPWRHGGKHGRETTLIYSNLGPLAQSAGSALTRRDSRRKRCPATWTDSSDDGGDSSSSDRSNEETKEEPGEEGNKKPFTGKRTFEGPTSKDQSVGGDNQRHGIGRRTI
jgi:hypothetical protein